MTAIRFKATQATIDAIACREGRYLFRLYVIGVSPSSRRAIVNINAICAERFAGRYDLEVIDLHQQPALAKSDQIMAVPTLIKHAPLPLRRIVGDLSDRVSLLVGLDLEK